MTRLVTGPRAAIATVLAMTLALALPVAAGAQPAPNARPTGGTVVAGKASISDSPTITTVEQSTQRAVVNWQSFDVGSRQEVQIVQPSTSAVMLLRVTGPNPSQIAGRIDSNGMIVLVNAAGVLIDKGAQINDSGTVISAPGITNQDFMAGKMVFNQASRPTATVETAGQMTVSGGGLLALLAPHVVGGGIIQARLGGVYLLGADSATLDLFQRTLVTLDAGNQVTSAPATPSAALVSLTGQVLAPGGLVELAGRAADGLVGNLVDVSGTVSAATVGSATGEIAITGAGGGAMVTGALTARGADPGTTGGKVGVDTSGPVSVKGAAVLNAAGEAGGGVIAVGTTLARAEGGPSVTAASISPEVTVASGVKLNADALGDGSGGRVTLLATGSNTFAGTITATGGPSGGNGGFVEVSGKTVGLTGTVNVSAPHGNEGTLLLDPVRFRCRLSRWNSPTPPPAGCVLVR